MARVSQDTIEKLNALINSLPAEARDKCAMCNATLVHFVKMAEVKTGAGTATVTKALAEKINETAAPGDRVNEHQLRGRVQRSDGSICTERADKPDWPTCKACGEEPVHPASLHRPDKRGLCYRCKRKAEDEERAAAKREFDKIPINEKADVAWSDLMHLLVNYIASHRDELHGKASPKTIDVITRVQETVDDIAVAAINASTYEGPT